MDSAEGMSAQDLLAQRNDALRMISTARAEAAMLREALAPFERWYSLTTRANEWAKTTNNPMEPAFDRVAADWDLTLSDIRQAALALSTPASDWLARRDAEHTKERKGLTRELTEANAHCLGVIEERRLARCSAQIAEQQRDEALARAEKAEAIAKRRQDFIVGCQQLLGTHDRLDAAIEEAIRRAESAEAARDSYKALADAGTAACAEVDARCAGLVAERDGLANKVAVALHALHTTHGLMAYDDATETSASQHFRLDYSADIAAIGIVEIYGPCERCGGRTDTSGECSKCRDFGGTDKVVRVIAVDGSPLRTAASIAAFRKLLDNESDCSEVDGPNTQAKLLTEFDALFVNPDAILAARDARITAEARRAALLDATVLAGDKLSQSAGDVYRRLLDLANEETDHA